MVFVEEDHCVRSYHRAIDSLHLVKHSAGVVTPNKNGMHFHL